MEKLVNFLVLIFFKSLIVFVICGIIIFTTVAFQTIFDFEIPTPIFIGFIIFGAIEMLILSSLGLISFLQINWNLSKYGVYSIYENN